MTVGTGRALRSGIALGLLLVACAPVSAQTLVRPVPSPSPTQTPSVRLTAPWRLTPANGRSQTPPQAPPSPTGRGSWQVELGVGGILNTAMGAGNDGQLPAPGGQFTVTGISGRTSRRVTSWAFGDGAVLLNDAIATLPGLPQAARIVPLDSVVTTTGLAGHVVVVGQFRIVKAVKPRYSIEAGLDAGPAPYTLSQGTLDQIEATRTSYIDAFQALFTSSQFTGAPSATSTASFRMSGGYRATLTGGVRFHFGSPQKLRTYVLAGGGGAFNFGDGPGFSLTGNYQFSSPGFGTRVWDETDPFMVTYHLAAARAVGVFGGGVSREFSRGRGIIVDARVHVSPDAFETRLEARPSRATGQNAVLSTPTVPSIQFSSVAGTGIPSTLQTTLSGFVSHNGSLVATTTVAVLYFIRY